MRYNEISLGITSTFQSSPVMRRCRTKTPIAPTNRIIIGPRHRIMPSSDMYHFARGSGDDNEEKLTMQQRIDKFLDTPIFDPNKILSEIDEQDNYGDGDTDDEIEGSMTENNRSKKKSSNAIARWFATLVQNDYETAEALYAAGFISIMVILTQELLRYVMFGDAYVPFQRGGTGGFGSGFKDWY